MNSTANAAFVQPYVASDIMGAALLAIGVLYAALWSRDRDPGMGWLACGAVCIGAWFATTPYNLAPGPVHRWSPWFFVLFGGLFALSFGLVDYLRVPRELRRRAYGVILTPAAMAFGVTAYVGLTGAQIPRSLGNLPVGAWFLALGGLAWWAARREPGAGHAFVAACLWSYPLMAVAMAVGRFDSVVHRYYAFGPLFVLMVTMLTVGLLRDRHALQAEVARRSQAEADLTQVNASLERKVAERTAELRELADGLEGFNRSISHDLRGSLGGIASAARLAHEGLQRGDPAQARRTLPLIADQADQSREQMQALLALARASDQALRREPVPLAPLVQEIVAQLQLQVQQTGGRVPQIEVAADLPTVHADRDLLRPALVNLIDNAMKFTRGIESARIEVGAVTDGTGTEVFVKDNGVGFDAAARARLFEPFVRLHGAQFEGHGLGLSMVRRAIERHGGCVWAEGEVGQGAVFRFRLSREADARMSPPP